MKNTYRIWGIILILLALTAFVFQNKTSPTSLTSLEKSVRDYHMFAVEHEGKWNGQKVETYRWDPGTLIVKKGERTRLHLHGFNGDAHSFTIPEFQVKGTVKKGQVTSVEFTPNREGTFELICLNHGNIDQKGPMIAYITVIDD